MCVTAARSSAGSCPRPTSPARTAAEKLRKLICEEPINYQDAQLDISVSCGIARAAAEHATYEEVIRLADTALYRAKREGRNRVCP